MTLNLRHVESFVAVAELLSFSAAAERTGTVQSAVSAHVRALERQVGRTLIARGRGRSVELTAEGAAFLVQARRLLALADELVLAQSGPLARQPIRLGTTATFALSSVPCAIAAFAQSDGAAPVVIKTARSHELRGLLDDGAVDVAFGLDQGPHPGRVMTMPVPLGWAGGDGVSCAETIPVALAFLEDARDLRRHALKALDRAGIPFVISAHPDPVALRAALLSGLAMTALPAIAIVPPLKDLGSAFGLPPLGEVPVSIYVAGRGQRAEVRAFTHCLRGSTS